MNDTIEHLNILWSILLQLYEKKESLPLGSFNSRYYLINGRREDQEIEISNWLNHWIPKLTKKNLEDVKEVTHEIDKCCFQLNEKLMELSLTGFTVVPITDFTPSDIENFNQSLLPHAQEFEMIKKKKSACLKIRDFEMLCLYRNKEKEIISYVSKEFARRFPGIYFEKSWFSKNEILHLPSGIYSLEARIKRLGRDCFKNN